jgi:transposase
MEEKKKAGHPKGKANRKYSSEFKVEVIETMHRERMGYHETSRQFLPDISDNTGTGYLKRWERIYLEEGPEGLAIERRGKSSRRAIHKPLKPDVEKDLIERIQYLEMENEYLKKLKALVSKREREEKKNRK